MITFKTYPCGMRLVCDYIPNRKVAQIAINVASGSGFDLEGKDGIAHYYEHMFFKSTKTRSTKQLLKTLDSFGARYNAFTSTDKTCYFGEVIVEDAEKFVEVLSDCFFNGIFDEEEMTTEKGVVCSEIDRYEDDFFDCCYEAAKQEIFSGTTFAHPILGNKKSVNSITADDLRIYRKNNNSAKNVVIAISGGVSQEIAEKFVEKYFLPYYEGFAVPTVYAEKSAQDLSIKNKKVFVKKDTKQVYFLHATPTIRGEHPDFVKLKVASAMFGGLSSSRLITRLREKEGLVYEVCSNVSQNAVSGVYKTYFACLKENAEKAILSYKDEINKVVNDGFSDEEINQIKHLYIRNLILNDDELSSRQSSAVMSVIREGKVYDMNEEISKIEQLSTNEVNKAFVDVLMNDNFVVSYLSGEEDIDILNLLK